ncbi:MAG: hypothetical protein WCO60_08945 [Verrucomicrobiota bacterium]
MNKLPNPHEEWFRLFAVAVNGDITDGNHKSLQRLLKTNSEARQLWFAYNDVECSLSELRPFSVQQCFVPFSLSDIPPLCPRSPFSFSGKFSRLKIRYSAQTNS